MQFTFAHNNFNVRDLDRSLAFYKEALGLSETRRINADDGSFIIVYLGDGKTPHLLELTWLRDWDRRSPMASWLWSRASFENLAKHFAGLLFTRMPDGRRALLRYYSPEVRRALEQVMTARQWTQVMAPLERWQVWQPLQGGYLVYDRETERTADA